MAGLTTWGWIIAYLIIGFLVVLRNWRYIGEHDFSTAATVTAILFLIFSSMKFREVASARGYKRCVAALGAREVHQLNR